MLSVFPQALTNHDFHNANIGSVGDQVGLIDWAYVGWGPIGHDVGHLAASLGPVGLVDPVGAWEVLETAYCDALVTASTLCSTQPNSSATRSWSHSLAVSWRWEAATRPERGSVAAGLAQRPRGVRVSATPFENQAKDDECSDGDHCEDSEQDHEEDGIGHDQHEISS